MNIDNKKLSIIIDVIIVVLIFAFAISIRMPGEDMIGSAQLNNEYTDDDVYYLSDPDSYLYARRAREYSLDLSGFSFVNNRTDDVLMSPVSSRDNGLITNALPLIAALVYRLLSIFSDVTIEVVVYYFNAVIASMAALLSYFFIKKLTNIYGGITSAILIVIMPPFLNRSVAGYFDTDAMLLSVPLCLIVCFTMMVFNISTGKKVFFSICSILSFLLLAGTWETFYIYFGLLIVMSIVTSLELYFVKGSDGVLRGKAYVREILYMSLSIIIMAALAICMYGGNIFDSIRRLVSNMLFVSDYPDPTRYILELSDVPFLDNGLEGAFLAMGNGIINNLGGIIIALIGFICIILLIVFRKRLSNKFLACNVGFVVTWFLITLPFLIVGSRFLELVCIPLSLLVGLFCGMISQVIIGNKKRLLSVLISLFISVIILFGPMVGAMVRRNIPTPFYSKTFDAACTWINTYASENASILTWWDYGYFIQFASARHVLSDGGTFDGRYFYFLAHALLTDDPKLSVAIFNMLNFSGVDSVDVIEESIAGRELAMNALLDILPVSKEEGLSILKVKYKLTDVEAADIIAVAKPEVRDERYLIISRDLITKINALSYYGLYDFHNDTYDVALGVSNKPVVASEYEERVDIRGIDDIAVVIKKDNDNDYVTLVDDEKRLVDISRIIYVEDGIKVRDEYKSDSGYTLYCINENGEYSFMVCSNNIADSMLVTLMTYHSNEAYTRVYAGILGDNMSSFKSITARFFGDESTPDNAGAYIFRVIN